MDTMLAFYAGGIILPVVAIIFLIAFLDNEKPFFAFISLAVLIAALQFFTDIKPVDIVRHSPEILIGYFALGVAWAVVKWVFFLYKTRSRYAEFRSTWLASHPTYDPGDLQRDARRTFGFAIPPRPDQHKARIVTWMIYWPFSLLWTMIDQPVRKFFNLLYAAIKDALGRLSRRIFAQFEADFQ